MAKDLNNPSFPVMANIATEPLGFFGSLTAARNDLMSIIPGLAFQQPIVSGRTGIRWHMVMDPECIERILKTAVDDYPKSDVTKRILRPGIGEGLFVVEGQKWRWQRRAVAPIFQVRNIDSLAPVMSHAAKNSADRIGRHVGGVVDVNEDMVRMTIEVIADVTFSRDDVLDAQAVSTAMSKYIEQIGKISILDMMGAPDWVPRISRILSPGGLTDLKKVADRSITIREEQGAKEVPDLLDHLMAAQDPKSERKMTREELRDNILTFVAAGHETTALALAWALYLCAFDQDVQDKARAEAQAALQGGVAGAAHIPQLKYTRQIIEETLRLYPPAAIVSRTALKPDRLRDREIRRGDTVMLPIYALQRHEMLWDNPNRFDPDRFGKNASHDRYAYIPFGHGPRICIGMEFALREAQIVLGTLLSKYRFELTDDVPEPHLLMTLRPRNGIKLKVSAA
jgi:cytochrome P450